METLELNNESLKDAIEKHPNLVVDCWAPWCGPCKIIGPIISELAKELDGKVVFGKLNVDDNQPIAQELGIMSIPTLLMYKDGKQIDSMVGALPKDVLNQKIKSSFGLD